MKKKFILLIMLCSAFWSGAKEKIGDLYYNLDNYSMTAEVTYDVMASASNADYVSGKLVIPDKIIFDGEEYVVNKIGDYAFDYCGNLTDVVIPNSIGMIGNSAFRNCTKLKNIIIPDSVFYLGISTFSDCTSLTDISIPNSVTSLEYEVFARCSNLKNVSMSNAIQSIDYGAFTNCSELTSIKLPDSIRTIGDYAFYRCSALQNISLPDSITYIGEYAFCYCAKLESIVLPDAITIIRDNLFFNCSSLAEVTLSEKITTICERAFDGCESLKGITIPQSVKTIENYSFYNCSSLTEVNIKGALTKIGNYAFSHCKSLQGFIIPASVSSMGANVFGSCTNMVKSAYPDIMKDPFVSGLTIEYPHNDCLIEDGVIYNAEKTVVYFVSSFFEGSYVLKNGIETIDSYAMARCDRLTDVVIPNSVSNIGRYAFDGSSINEVTIGNSVVSIDSFAFNDCSQLDIVNCYSLEPPVISDYTTFPYASNETLHVVKGCRDFYANDAYWGLFKQIIDDLESDGNDNATLDSALSDPLNLIDNKIYDLMGRKVKEMIPGTIYIRNGKKIFRDH